MNIPPPPPHRPRRVYSPADPSPPIYRTAARWNKVAAYRPADPLGTIPDSVMMADLMDSKGVGL